MVRLLVFLIVSLLMLPAQAQSSDKWNYAIQVAPQAITRINNEYSFSLISDPRANWTFGACHFLPEKIQQSLSDYLRVNGMNLTSGTSDYQLKAEILTARAMGYELPPSVKVNSTYKRHPWLIWTLQIHLYHKFRLQGSWEAKGYTVLKNYIRWKKMMQVHGEDLNVEFAKMYADLTRQLAAWINALPPKQVSPAPPKQPSSGLRVAKKTSPALPEGLKNSRLIIKGDYSSFGPVGSYHEAIIHPKETVSMVREIVGTRAICSLKMIHIKNLADGRAGIFLKTEEGALFSLMCTKNKNGAHVASFSVFSGRESQGDRMLPWSGSEMITLSIIREGDKFTAFVNTSKGNQEIGSLNWPGLSEKQQCGILMKGNSDGAPATILLEGTGCRISELP